MGSANTAAIKARMTAGSVASSDYAAGMASAYTGGGLTDWFLPSKDELNAMCNYSRNPTAPAAPSVSCFGSAPGSTQNGAFAAGTYGFASVVYWSSSQYSTYRAWDQYLNDGSRNFDLKPNPLRVRPVRSFCAIHPFIYLSLLFSVFRSWLLVRKAAVPVGVRGGGLVCGVGPVGRTPHSFS